MTNLSSTSTASFDGSANVTPGVYGTLPVTRGGTGATSIDSLKSTLGISNSAKIIKGTFISDSTGKSGKITIGFHPYLFIMIADKNADNNTNYDIIQIHDDYAHVGYSFNTGVSHGTSYITIDGINQAVDLIKSTKYSYVAIGK